MKIERMMAGVFAANCYIVWDEESGACFVVDPGGDVDDICNFVDEHGLKPLFILLTHGHGDHIAAVPEIRKKYEIPVYVHEKESELLGDSSKNMSLFMPIAPVELTADRMLKDREIISEGPFELKVIHTPGHTGGSCCFKLGKYLFTGDTLFKGSIGRTDLATGNKEEMSNSLKNIVLVQKDDLIVLSGHGVESTIGYEKKNNLFLRRL